MPAVSGRLAVSIGLTSIAVEASAIDRPSFIGKEQQLIEQRAVEIGGNGACHGLLEGPYDRLFYSRSEKLINSDRVT